MKNQFTFAAEGLGTFTSYIEPPATQMMIFRERKEKADMVGGMLELHKMEAYMNAHRNSNSPEHNQAAYSVALNLLAVNNYLEIKRHIIDTPDNFAWESLTPNQFNVLYEAWEAKHGSFRQSSDQRKEKTPENAATQPEGTPAG